MIRNIIISLVTLVGITSSMAIMASPAVVYAASTVSSQQACNGLDQINSVQSCGTSKTSGTSTVNKMVSIIISTLSWFVGIVSVIVIIIAGFQFITSGGDSNRVNKAKNALFYAMIGLLIVALAQFLVHFVLNNVTA